MQKQQEFVKHAYEKFGKSQLSVDELKQANKKFGCKYAPQWLIKNKDYKVGKSLFKLPTENDSVVQGETEKVLPVQTTNSEAAYVVSSLVGNIVSNF